MQSDVNRLCPVINVMLMGLVWTIDGLVAQETDTFGVGNDLGFCRTPILCVKTKALIFQGCQDTGPVIVYPCQQLTLSLTTLLKLQ